MMCENCNTEPIAETHEIFFNGKANRKLCIDYKLTIDLCRTCHNSAHGKHKNHRDPKNLTKREMQQRFCVLKRIDFDETNLAINTHAESVRSKLYLKEISKGFTG